MPANAQLRSASAVLNWYNDQPQAAFKLYRFSVMSKNITGAYSGKSKEEGAEKLQSELALIANDDYNNYVLGLFEDKDKDKTTPALNKVFVINEQPYGVMAGYNIGARGYENEILSELRAIRAERLEDKQAENREDEEEETPSSILVGMLKQPNVQQMLIDVVGGFARNFSRPTVQAVSGTHSEADIAQILQTLYAKGVTPDDLGKLAAMDQKQISFLLQMLRK